MTSRLKSWLERLESDIITAEAERQIMEIQFISPEKVVTSTLSVILGPTFPSQTCKFDRQRRAETPTDNAEDFKQGAKAGEASECWERTGAPCLKFRCAKPLHTTSSYVF